MALEITAWIIVLVSLIFIIKEDFTERYIQIYWLFSIFMSWLFLFIGDVLLIDYHDIVINILQLLFQFLLLNIYFSIKSKHWIWITKEYLGIGDILFLLVLALFFKPIDFLFFYIFTLLATLVISIVVRYFKPHTLNTIPLAGFFAIAMTIYIFQKHFFHYFAT